MEDLVLGEFKGGIKVSREKKGEVGCRSWWGES